MDFWKVYKYGYVFYFCIFVMFDRIRDCSVFVKFLEMFMNEEV